MFISKRKFNEKLEEAAEKAREHEWSNQRERCREEDMRQLYRDLNQRLIALEKKTGIIEEPPKCPCQRNANQVAPMGF